MNFAGDFLLDLSCLAFFLGKKQKAKIHPKIHSKIQIRIWEFPGQNPHRKDLPLNKTNSCFLFLAFLGHQEQNQAHSGSKIRYVKAKSRTFRDFRQNQGKGVA